MASARKQTGHFKGKNLAGTGVGSLIPQKTLVPITLHPNAPDARRIGFFVTNSPEALCGVSQ
jgi:hypothetical protein